MEISNSHLGSETLRSLADGRFTARASQLNHLVVCDSCAGNLIQLFPEGVRGRVYELLDEQDGPPPVMDLPAVLSRLLATYRTWREAQRAAAPAAVETLLELSQEERLTAIREVASLATLPVAQALLEEIPRWWHRDPHHAGDLAEVAVAILAPMEHAAPFLVPPSRALESLSHAWALHGNALRVQGELVQAEKVLEHAGELADQSEDLTARARVARLLAELFRDQRRFDGAAEACREAEELYTEAGDLAMSAWSRVVAAWILGDGGDHEGAVALLESALGAERRGDLSGEMALAAAQSLCHELYEAGRSEEALERLEEVKALTAGCEEPLALCRVAWVRALALVDTGEQAEAEVLLRGVLDTFLEHELAYDAALVGLDLAASYLRVGKSSQARELGQELNPIFLSRGIHREATAAGLLVARALESETATVALLRDVIRFLQQARRDPSLSYNSPGN